jgi:hypothetical protein
MAVDRDRLKQQYYQEQTAKQIAQTYVIQWDAEIQQLKIRNQETTTESIAYQDRITTL